MKKAIAIIAMTVLASCGSVSTEVKTDSVSTTVASDSTATDSTATPVADSASTIHNLLKAEK